MHRHVFMISLLLAAAFATGSLHTRAQGTTSPREQLQQYVAELQNNPDDQNLREKIITLALTIHPALAIPDKDKVLEAEGEANGALKTAKSQADYSDAVKLFQKALLLAPWDADVNYNLAKAQEMAKQYDDAIASYKLYLLASPDAKDHDAVLEKIGELKFDAKKTVEENSPEALALRQQQDEQKFISNLDGTRYSCYTMVENQNIDFGVTTLDIRGGTAVAGRFRTGAAAAQVNDVGWQEWGRAPVTGRDFTIQVTNAAGTSTERFKISTDGNKISVYGEPSGSHFWDLGRQLRNDDYEQVLHCRH
jgi:tetratricopeptide (TPR) repeat protein